MLCTTIKEGTECAFMSKKGCEFNGGACHTIVEECQGCERIFQSGTGQYCKVFPQPAIKWRRGACNMATHKKGDNGKSQAASKVRMGQQKQKKKK